LSTIGILSIIFRTKKNPTQFYDYMHKKIHINEMTINLDVNIIYIKNVILLIRIKYGV